MSDESRKEEILINVTPSEVRAALLENGVLQEVFIERAARRGLISNIYNGSVSRVLPGMQAAFVDFGHCPQRGSERRGRGRAARHSRAGAGR